jgi:sugar phosphate isomerase/epimerase
VCRDIHQEIDISSSDTRMTWCKITTRRFIPNIPTHPSHISTMSCRYVHIGESHRGYLGTGSVDFPGLFRALAATGYAGPLTFESFSSEVVNLALSNTLCVWRNL